jgi:hypothetical protein
MPKDSLQFVQWHGPGAIKCKLLVLLELAAAVISSSDGCTPQLPIEHN